MDVYQYKCVAGPTVISVTDDQEKAKAVKAFEDIINREAGEGWEYVGIDEFQTAEQPGCFGGNQPKYTMFKMLVFRKARAV